MEEYALGQNETPDGRSVLTFSADDQQVMDKCAAQLKVLAIEGRLLSASGAGVSLLSVQANAGSLLASSDALDAVVDSPWASDACSDIAHSYLTAHLAHPEMAKSDFCPMYQRDFAQLRNPAVMASQHAQAAASPQHTDASKPRARGTQNLVQKSHAKAEALAAERVVEEQSASAFLRDAALSSAQNVEAVAYELRLGGDSNFQSGTTAAATDQTAPKPVAPKPALRPKVQAASSPLVHHAAQPARVVPARSISAAPVASLPSTSTAVHAQALPAADDADQGDSGENDSGADFWREMLSG